MQIYGPGPIHGAHSIRPAQAPRATNAAEIAGPVNPRDEVEISEMGHLLESLRGVSDMRMDRIQQIRTAIADGSYDSQERMSLALDRLLDEIG